MKLVFVIVIGLYSACTWSQEVQSVRSLPAFYQQAPAELVKLYWYASSAKYQQQNSDLAYQVEHLLQTKQYLNELDVLTLTMALARLERNHHPDVGAYYNKIKHKVAGRRLLVEFFYSCMLKETQKRDAAQDALGIAMKMGSTFRQNINDLANVDDVYIQLAQSRYGEVNRDTVFKTYLEENVKKVKEDDKRLVTLALYNLAIAYNQLRDPAERLITDELIPKLEKRGVIEKYTEKYGTRVLLPF